MRILSASSIGLMKILPSPILPERAAPVIASTTASTRLSSTATSILVFGKYSVVLPANRLVRITLGVVLVVLGGLFGFLPVLGYWMVPVGFLILATDLPPIRRFNRRVTIAVVAWWTSRKSHEERKAARRNGSSERVAQPDREEV